MWRMRSVTRTPLPLCTPAVSVFSPLSHRHTRTFLSRLMPKAPPWPWLSVWNARSLTHSGHRDINSQLTKGDLASSPLSANDSSGWVSLLDASCLELRYRTNKAGIVKSATHPGGPHHTALSRGIWTVVFGDSQGGTESKPPTFPILSCFALTPSYIRGLHIFSHKSIPVPFKGSAVHHSVIVLSPTQTSLSNRSIC